MGWGIGGCVAGRETLVRPSRVAWGGVGRGGVGTVAARGGAVVQGRGGARVERGGQGEWRVGAAGARLGVARGVARRDLAVEGSEAGVVAVRGDAEAVGRGGGRDAGAGRQFGEYLQRPLEALAGVGRDGEHLRPAEPDLVNQEVGEVLRLKLDVLEVLEDSLRQLLLLAVGVEALTLQDEGTAYTKDKDVVMEVIDETSYLV